MLNWATMFGMIGALPGELLQYTPTWHHGHGYMRFLPKRERKKPMMPQREMYGGFTFKDRVLSSTSIRRQRPRRSTSFCMMSV